VIAERLAALLGAKVARVEPLSATTYRALLADGERVFVKTRAGEPADFLTSQAAGLRWLAAAAPDLVVEVLAADGDTLVLRWLDSARPDLAAAERFGVALAGLHRAAPRAYGASWPGYIGPLPMPNDPAPDWPTFYGEQRLRPFLRLAVDRGSLAPAATRAVEQVIDRLSEIAGPPEPVARLHGDLWSGNVVWTPAGARLVDPAAHGGHRETDLAMLALFGAPHLDRILAAYEAAWPLAEGWRARVPLHQLHPLLVHAALFGGWYGDQAGAAATAALRGS
jgi:fructosamine-3-kinase